MSDGERDYEWKLQAIYGAIADSIMEMSAEEILAEACEAGEDPARIAARVRDVLRVSSIPYADKPSNPYQATTIGNLVTSTQLHWLTVAAESVGRSKEQAALELLNCPVNSLSREAAQQLLIYFGRVKSERGV